MAPVYMKRNWRKNSKWFSIYLSVQNAYLCMTTDDDILEIYAGVLTSAHKGDMERASTEAQNTIVKRLGESEGEQLLSAVSNHMDQSLDDSSVFFPMRYWEQNQVVNIPMLKNGM